MRSGDAVAARRFRLRHIADAIASIRADTSRGKKAFLKSRVHQQAVILNLMIIGEAIKHIDARALSTRPEIPWNDIAGLRDIVAHKYFHLDLDTIWDVVEKDLAPVLSGRSTIGRW